MIYFEFTSRSPRSNPSLLDSKKSVGSATDCRDRKGWIDMRESALSAKPELLAALADVGVEPDDYALIEQARALVDKVNGRLRRRGSRMIYTITFCNAVPVQEDVDS